MRGQLHHTSHLILTFSGRIWILQHAHNVRQFVLAPAVHSHGRLEALAFRIALQCGRMEALIRARMNIAFPCPTAQDGQLRRLKLAGARRQLWPHSLAGTFRSLSHPSLLRAVV